MHIKMWNGKIGKVYIRAITQVEEGKDMVVQMSNCRNENPAIEISLVDMLFDRNKRECIYNQYDKNYLSTQEEDEIFQDMMGVGFDDFD